MYLINDENLNNILLNSNNMFTKQYPEYIEIINFLHNTGLRISDLFNFENFNIIDDNNFTLLQSKNKTIRTFNIELLPNYLKYYFNNKTNHKPYLSLNTLIYILNKINNYNLFYVNNRFVSSYIYRYNIYKIKYKQLDNVKAVSQEMGEINDFNTMGYIFSKIYTLNKNLAIENSKKIAM